MQQKIIFKSKRHAVSSPPFSRRSFLVKTSRFGAFYAAAKLIPLLSLESRESMTFVCIGDTPRYIRSMR
jgi:hypothetical protein